jgi:hypothetical protein
MFTASNRSGQTSQLSQTLKIVKVINFSIGFWGPIYFEWVLKDFLIQNRLHPTNFVWKGWDSWAPFINFNKFWQERLCLNGTQAEISEKKEWQKGADLRKIRWPSIRLGLCGCSSTTRPIAIGYRMSTERIMKSNQSASAIPIKIGSQYAGSVSCDAGKR